MARLKLGGTGDNPVVPGQEEAKRAKEDEKKRREQENLDAETPLLYTKESKEEDLGPQYIDNRIRFTSRSEINPYAEQQRKRYALDYRTRRIIALIIAVLACFYVVVCIPTSSATFSNITDFSAAEFLMYWNNATQALLGVLAGQDSFYATAVWTALAALLAGAALGLTGGIYQGALGNALASPSTLGVMNGGTLGIVLYILFFYDSTSANLASGVRASEVYDIYAEGGFWNLFFNYYGFGMFFAALLGCGIVVALVLLIATFAGRGRVSNVSLIIAGQVFSSTFIIIIQWIKEYIKTTTDDEYIAELIDDVQTATFDGVYTNLTMIAFAVPLIICIIVVFAMSGRLSLLAFDDEEARSMGISTGFTRNLLVALCTILTALVIAYVGPIGFVGFMVPHIARNMVGPNFKYLLPMCMCIGSLVVMVSYAVSNLGIMWTGHGGTGMITSLFGSIMFIVVAFRSRGTSNGTWL